MKPISILNENSHDELYIDFTIGTICNYKCYYCFEGLNDGQFKFPTDIDLTVTNLKYLLDLYNKSNIRLHITGGEPTHWNQLDEFVSHFQSCKVTLSTNGSKKLEWWEKNSHLFDCISISVHAGYSDVEHLSKVATWIYDNTDTFIECTVLMDPQNWSHCVSMIEEFTNKDISWLLKVRPVILKGDSSHYSNEQYLYMKDKVKNYPSDEYIRKMSSKISSKTNLITTFNDGSVQSLKTIDFFEHNWHHFTGWSCNVGVDRFSIDRDGTIKGACGAKNLFGLTEPLSIYDPNLTTKITKNMIQPTICQLNYCECPSDIKITKHVL